MTTKRIVRISYFTMLTVIGGMIKIPAGTVSFTLQTLFVILSGFVLGGKDGMFAQLAYMVLGLIGVPVFTEGGGFSYIFKPSFGYIISFPLGAYIAGFLFYRFKTINNIKMFASAMSGLVSIYIIGMAYQVMILVLVNGLSFAAAAFSLLSILIYFGIDTVTLYLLCLIYPRLMDMLKIDKRERTQMPFKKSSDASRCNDVKKEE